MACSLWAAEVYERIWRPWDGKHTGTWFPWKGFIRILCRVCSWPEILSGWNTTYNPELLICMLNTRHLWMFSRTEGEQNCLHLKAYWACTQRALYSEFPTVGFCFDQCFLLETLVLILTFPLRILGCFKLSALKAFSFIKITVAVFKRSGQTLCSLATN